MKVVLALAYDQRNKMIAFKILNIITIRKTQQEGDENQIYFNICIFYIFSSPRRSYVINVLSFKHYHYSSFSNFTGISSTHDEVNIGIKTNISLRVCALFLKDVLVISWKLNLYHLTNT